MIFVLHYLLFNAGLPAIIILITLFLQTYSDASLAEIGALLMALPFVSILIKPLFCALADRQQAHKLYLICALGLMALGYGSLSIAPFFPDFVKDYGRIVWYFDIVGIIIGFSAFGVIWSLGDALAVNHAQMRGVTWGTYRVWGVVSWGGFGIIIGQINEVPFLPKYVPALFVLIVALLAEMVLLAVWPNKHFIMGGTLDEASIKAGGENGSIKHNPDSTSDQQHQQQQQMRDMEDNWSSANRSLTGTLRGTARANPRMIGAVANIFMEDLGGTLRSSLKLGGKPKRMGLDEILEQHQVVPVQSSGSLIYKGESALASAAVYGPGNPTTTAANDAQSGTPTSHNTSAGATTTKTNSSSTNTHRQSVTGTTFGRATLRRAQMALARMNSLSAASGHVIADEVTTNMNSYQNESIISSAVNTPPMPVSHQHQRQQVMYMSSLASDASLGRAAAARMFGLKESPLSLVSTSNNNNNNKNINNNLNTHSNNFNNNINNNNILPSTPEVAGGEDDKQLVAVNLNDPQQIVGPANGGGGGGGGLEVGFDGMSKPKQLRSAEDLQLVLLKLIVRRDTSIWKYLVMFTIFGSLLTCHLSYFFVHLEQLCRKNGNDFSSVTGGMMAAHSVSEVFSFTFVVPYLVPKVGRSGALLSCAIIYAARFAYYGTYLSHTSPYTAIPFELAHGIVYGIVYSLITDIACECVNQVDLYLPELIERGVVDPSIDPSRLKLQLRATMQGLFSGAFDGLGNGIGALFGGVYLDSGIAFAKLWQFCTYVCLVTIVIYPLTEWNTFFGKQQRDNSKQAKC